LLKENILEYSEYLEKIWSLIQKGLELIRLRAEGDEGAESQCAAMGKERAVLETLEKEAVAGEEFFAIPYLLWLGTRNSFERHLLYFLFCFEFQPGCRRMCQELGWKEITLELAMFTFEEGLSVQECYYTLEQDTMFTRCFLQIGDMEEEVWETQGFFERGLRLNQRIANLMLTCEPLYPPYRSFLRVFTREDILSKGSRQEEGAGIGMENGVLHQLLQVIQRAALSGEYCIIEICGQKGSGRKRLLSQISAALGQEMVLWRVHIGLTEGKRQQQYMAWIRECRLWGAIPALQMESGEDGQTVRELFMLADEERIPVVIFLTEKAHSLSFCEKALFSFDMPDISMDMAARIWQEEAEHYAIAEELRPEAMAGKFVLTEGKIREAFAMADTLRMVEGAEEITGKLLHQGCYRILEGSMGDKAQRIETIFGWEDIVLPEDLVNKLKTACSYVKYRQKVYGEWGLSRTFAYGKGVSMVFAGAPGTGKTMAAQVMAGEMDMELYRVNLAAIVSKYIGETEKNLNEVFERAKRSQVILLFDEADVLFSRRTEVKDSNDKHSNMEAAFLLQKMEEYEGVSILTTNFIQNFDEAFRRRMAFIMDFPFPDAEYRKQIWKKAVPKQLPAEELDFDYLSKTFSLSGSNIKNIVRHSAFLAAADDCAVGMEQILAAVKNEYAKLGKILTAEEAGEYYMLLQK